MTRATGTWAAAIFLLLSSVTLPVTAETVYVADRFEIGVHGDTNIDSVIVAVIPSGTPLEVISRKGEFVEVSTPDGTKGWIDARYVVSEKSSAALLAEYDAKIQVAVHALGAARAEVEVLRQRVTELQRDAATAAQSSPDVAKPVSLAANEDSAKLKKAKRELEGLAQENQQLKVHVADLQADQIAAAKSATESKAMEEPESRQGIWHGPVSDEVQTWTPWQWLLFGSILLLTFAAGGYAVDWESRRRHGGFRV